MANIKLVVNPINVPNFIVIVVEYVNDLGVEVTRQDFAPPHTQRNLTFPGLDPVMCRFFFWESSDGVALDTLLGSADIDASLAFDFLVELYEVTVGGAGTYDPASDQNQYRNPGLLNCELLTPGVTPSGPAYTVSQRGVGQKLLSEITNVPDPGGFDLAGLDKFYSGDIWFITKYSRVVAAVPASSGGWIQDVVLITDQVTTLGAGHRNREIEVSGSFDVMTLQMENLATLADKIFFVFNSHRLTGKYLFIDFTAGGTLWFEGQELSSFWLAAGEELAIVIKGGKARVISYTGNAGSRGRVIFDYKNRFNTIPADGSTYTQAQVPALYAFVQSLPGGVAADFTTWGTSSLDDEGRTVYLHKGRYAIDAGSVSIKVPDLRNQFIRGLSLGSDTERPTNQPGSGQQGRVGKFRGIASVPKANSYTGGPNNDKIGNGNNSPTSQAVSGIVFTTKDALNQDVIETRPFNVGLIPLIIL